VPSERSKSLRRRRRRREEGLPSDAEGEGTGKKCSGSPRSEALILGFLASKADIYIYRREGVLRRLT
jgi:hypothetical protein